MHIRRATAGDASDIATVLRVVVGERVHSAIANAWSVEQEISYLASLSPREAVHIAIGEGGHVVGLQTLDRWSAQIESMAHVGQVGTFLLPAHRGRGIGRALWQATRAFAQTAHYRKLVIYVRGSNVGAQAFYHRLGFRACGRLQEQVIIDGVADDEVLMEVFLSEAG